MQALTVAIAPSGLQYLAQELIVGQFVSALTNLVPPNRSISVPDITLSTSSSGAMTVAEHIVITLSGGSLSSFNPRFQSLTQGAGGQFTLTLVASGCRVNYTWNEQYDTYLIYFGSHNEGHTNDTWGYSMGVDTFTITVPVTLTQQAQSYNLAIGTVTATPTGLHPNIPGNSIVQQPGPCFTTTVDNTTVSALEAIDFQTPIQNLFKNLLGTIPASGKLTPDIVFSFNEGDTALAFPNNAGISLGVTGNVTWNGNAYSGGTPPSLPIPSMPTSNHVHFFAADYEFNELFWAWFKDGRLNTTITAGQLPDPGMLNTNYYRSGPLAPLYQAYPNLQMTVAVTPQSPPTVTFQSVYQLVYGDNGVLTTQESALPASFYQALSTLQGSVYLSQGDYTTALQNALGPTGTQYITQIEQASVVTGPFTRVYQVTQAGLNTLQANLPPGVYQNLSAGLTVGQVFVDQAWLLAAVEYALNSVDQTNQYAAQIEAAFAVSGPFNQVWWVTPGTNGGLTTLVDRLPPDVYNDITGLANIVYLDQTSFVTALQNAIGSSVGKYQTQILQASYVTGAIVTQNVQAVFNVIRAGNTIPVFTVAFHETDFQQNFHLGAVGYNQTVQSDLQLIDGETQATLVHSNIKGIDNSSFPSIWNFVLQPIYALETQKMAHTGVPLPFMEGFEFLFNQATVAIQPGYADVLANMTYIGTSAYTEALTHDPASVDLSKYLTHAGAGSQSGARQPASPVPATVGAASPARMAGGSDLDPAAEGAPYRPELAAVGAAGRPPTLSRTRTAAARTRLVRRDEPRKPALAPRPAGKPDHTRPADETFDFHFALGHIPDVEEFHLHTGRERLPLKRHTPDTLRLHATKNRALGLMCPSAQADVTHYVEDVSLSATRARILRVTYPSQDANIPDLALMSVHVPRWARTAHRARKLYRSGAAAPANLALLGISAPLSPDAALGASIDADHILTTTSTASTIVFHHPQLATSNPTDAATVMDDHINSAANLPNIQRFQGQINRQGPNWQASVPSTDVNGKDLIWGPNFSRAGQTVYRNQLSPATIAGAAGPLSLPLTTSQQDPALQNASWSVNQGTGTVYHVSPEATGGLRAGRARSKLRLKDVNGYSFTLNNLTPGHGLDIDDGSLSFTPSQDTPGAGTVTINVSNSYLRSLYAFAQFLDANGTVIPVDGDKYLAIDVVTPVNVVLGIPLPTEPTVLSFDWSADAASARLVHGGLGTSRWDNDICWPGAILTGVFNYAIPGLFLLIGAELDDNAWFKTIEKEKPVTALLLKLCLAVVGTEASASVAFPDVSAILSALADAIAGILVHEGLEELQAYIVEKLGETAFEDAIPGVDIFFQIANRAVDLAEIAETTVEVLTSPAVYEVDIVRTLDLQVTVSPDPTHGTNTNPAIWPQEATAWEAIVQYKGGTSHTQTGSMMDLSTSSQPVVATFDALPAGGSLQVKFNVYSATGFLAGQYTSAWQDAVLPRNADVLTVTGSIQENPVPLTAGTVYQYKQKLIYNAAASAHMWQPGQFTLPTSEAGNLDRGTISTATRNAFQQNGITLDNNASVNVVNPGAAWTITDQGTVYRIAEQTQTLPGGKTVTVLMVNTANVPLQVVTDLSGDNVGHNLAKLVNITMNDKAYMLGYCWQASGQNIPETGGQFPVATQIHAFQNINVLANPEAALKFPASGFANQPALIYDEFGPAPLFSVPSTYSTTLDGGTISPDLAALFAAFAYPLPNHVISTVVTPGAAWTVGLPNATPTYSLARVTDVIEVHPYPTEAISQRNYYVQPTSDSPTAYQYQLRHVTLDDTTPFDMNQSTSWGLFTLPFNDDFVVHPQGYVVAISYTLSRMMILKLPDEAAPDDQVTSAVILSGPAGPQARQGLMNGPVALSVTADGRILVLEQGLPGVPGRIQAFDVNGNPVPCFDGTAITTVPTSFAADLNAGLVSVALRQALAAAGTDLSSVWLVQDGATLYQLVEDDGVVVVTSGGANLSLHWAVTSNGATYDLALSGDTIAVSRDSTALFTMPASLSTKLNAGITTGDVADAFSANGITLVAPVGISGDQFTLDGSVVGDLVDGRVPDSLGQGLETRGISLSANATVSGTVAVTVIQPGSEWTLRDVRASSSYKISADPNGAVLDVVNLLATAPLYDQTSGVTYLAMSTELKGYIYVLSYTGDGSSPSDYQLDIYQPNGAWLSRTSGVNAAKIVLDMWRNLYSLNYEAFLGPGGRTEPSVSTWIPSS